MGKVNEGVRRLSLVLGLIGLTIWLGVTGVLWNWGLSIDLGLPIYQARIHAEHESIVATVDRLWKRAPGSPAHLMWKKKHAEHSQLLVQHNQTLFHRHWCQNNNFLKIVSVVLAGGGLAFFLPWGTVRTIAWIIDGFKQTSQKESEAHNGKEG